MLSHLIWTGWLYIDFFKNNFEMFPYLFSLILIKYGHMAAILKIAGWP